VLSQNGGSVCHLSTTFVWKRQKRCVTTGLASSRLTPLSSIAVAMLPSLTGLWSVVGKYCHPGTRRWLFCQLSRGVDLRVAVERLGHRRRLSPGPDEDVGRVDRRHLDGDEIVPRTRNRQVADLYRFRGPGSARNAAHLVASMHLQGVR
jgi:hypothetical protein